MASKALVYSIVVLAVLVVGAIVFMQSGSDEEDIGVPQTGGQTGEQQAGGTQPEMQPSITEFSIEADDYGFYMNGAEISSISANLGEALEITFNVRTTNVYYAGLDFRGCGLNTGKVSPGSSKTVEFTMQDACTITSYWPSSGVVKDRLQVSVI
ncbi:MAG: hypothetical protein U1B79_01155 [Candidatus Pacearchaeota archaeon]|nr:hypothetical protein [Nanoarchaeota archaeon]MDZ4226698.1 hypothetical protein [Candidatus Pacearchaeota archaeon]